MKTKKARIAELEQANEQLERALREAQKEAALSRQTAWNNYDQIVMFISDLSMIFYGDEAIGELTIDQLPRIIKEKIDELNDIKQRIRQFTWELK